MKIEPEYRPNYYSIEKYSEKVISAAFILAGLSKKVMALSLGISPSHLSKIISHERKEGLYGALIAKRLQPFLEEIHNIEVFHNENLK
jgi:predicted transcriptional regulator